MMAGLAADHGEEKTVMIGATALRLCSTGLGLPI